MVNPLNWRTILLERHAQHVVFIHFPIGLFISGVVFDLFSGGKRDSHLGTAAYLNLSVAGAFLIPTIVSGVLAWQFALGGARLEGILLLHVVAAMSATALIVATWWLHWRARKSRVAFLPRNRIPVELLGVAVIALTAHLGGFVSGINH
jgi:uncharacterized membrane protein